jgi:hypothetical protein
MLGQLVMYFVNVAARPLSADARPAPRDAVRSATPATERTTREIRDRTTVRP